MKNIYAVFALLMLVLACNQTQESELKPFDLLEYGVPLTIQVPDPDSVDVTTGKLGLSEEVTIRKGNDYSIQIVYGEANTTNLGQLKESVLEDTQENPYFSKIITEEDKGFVYELNIDSTFYYDFVYLHLMGDKLYRFSPATAPRNQKKATWLYEAIQQQ